MRMAYPEASVIVSNFNNARYLERCIRSVLSQKTNFSFEVIVVDDASTDDSWKVLSHFEDRITVLRNEENLGLPASLNLAIERALGQFLVRVDSDDFVSENFLQILTLALKSNPSLDAVCCDYEKIEYLGANKRQIEICDSKREPIACGVMFRRDQLIEVGLYNPEFRFNEEKELRIRFEAKFEIARVPIPLYRYRQHSGSMSKDGALKSTYDAKLKEIID